MHEFSLLNGLTLGMGFDDPEPPYIAGLVMIVFAALSVWLTIRIVNRRERWAKWTLATVVALPILYVASFGPACWLVSRIESFDSELPEIYTPIGWLCWKSPFLKTVIHGYGRLGMSREQHVVCPVAEDMYQPIVP